MRRSNAFRYGDHEPLPDQLCRLARMIERPVLVVKVSGCMIVTAQTKAPRNASLTLKDWRSSDLALQ
jgi:hypothetical protein